ncbi:MAG TPA: ATP-binding protein [Dermatophilaceae bacterium]|nr:ATP-binding protein [Dermatophilaceae bacterium]
MTVTAEPSTWVGNALVRETCVVADDDAVVHRVARFVADAARSGQPVVAIVTEGTWQLLTDRLGARMAAVSWVADAADFEDEYDAVLAYHRLLLQFARRGRPWRSICEPVWLREDAGQAWRRYQAALDADFPEARHYALQVYDLRRQPAPVSHQPGPRWKPRPKRAVVARHTDARQARAWVAGSVPAQWSSRVDDVALAVHELVTNALREVGSAEVSWWAVGDRLVVEVRDDGPGIANRAAGAYPPDDLRDSGRGLWIAGRVADECAIRPRGPGTVVRLAFGL